MSEKLASRNAAIRRIVERQMRNWEIGKTVRDGSVLTRGPVVEDFVTISREVGASGTAIANELGRVLGWPVFDRELLHAMAGDDDVRERVYASLDEKDLGWVEEALRSFTQPEFVKNDYIRQLTRTVLSIARKGCAIFLGRGIDLILPEDVGLRVRLVAPLDMRAAVYAKEHGISTKEAMKTIAQIERDRDVFVQRYFKQDRHGTARFDITVNSRRFTSEQAVQLILAAQEVVLTPV